MELVKTSYNKDDVIILLQDVRGRVPVLDTLEREKLNQKGVHYSEMLPLEYVPTEKYMEIYENSLKTLSYETACAVATLSKKIIEKHGKEKKVVIYKYNAKKHYHKKQGHRQPYTKLVINAING